MLTKSRKRTLEDACLSDDDDGDDDGEVDGDDDDGGSMSGKRPYHVMIVHTTPFGLAWENYPRKTNKETKPTTTNQHQQLAGCEAHDI